MEYSASYPGERISQLRQPQLLNNGFRQWDEAGEIASSLKELSSKKVQRLIKVTLINHSRIFYALLFAQGFFLHFNRLKTRVSVTPKRSIQVNNEEAVGLVNIIVCSDTC